MPGSDDGKWKEKYLRSLDDLERKEQQFASAEELLRRSVGRLAHLGYGVDRVLDRQLDRIREAVRSGREAAGLERLVRETCDGAVPSLEEAQRTQAQIGPALAGLLARLHCPGERARQLERLHRELEGAVTLERLRPLLEELAAVLAEPQGAPSASSPEPAAPPATPEARREPSRPGLLSRLLGPRDGSAPGAATTLHHAPAVLIPATPSAPPDTPVAQEATTLERLLQGLQPGPHWQERISSLLRQAAACRGETEAARLLEETAVLLAEVLEAAERIDPQGTTVVETLPAAGETLIQLLERIEVPLHMQDRLTGVKGALARAATAKQMGLAVQSVADLLGDLRREVQEEKQELERFLEGVTSRIQVISEHVLELGGGRRDSSTARGELQRSLRDQMRGMRSRVQDAHDVPALKRAIEEGLDAIEAQMDHYVEREESLTRAAEERIADLSARLHDIKHEAFLLQQRLQEQRELAMTDPLTGIPNRLAYEERVGVEYQRWRRYGDALSLLIIDIDYFKRINDRFGHLAGDKALKALATRLQQSVRDVDLVARYGGEELVVVMPSTTPEQAYMVAEKLRSLVETAAFHYRQQPVAITISCGVAGFAGHDEPADVLRRADEALYAAKQAGRNCTRLARPAEATG
jgi:diguanylate cyclase